MNNDTPHASQNWTQCDTVSCVSAAVRTIGAFYYCERHAAQELIPLIRKRIYDQYGFSFDIGIGLGRYETPAYGWEPGYVNLRCDYLPCNATWVGRLASFEVCQLCLKRAFRDSGR